MTKIEHRVKITKSYFFPIFALSLMSAFAVMFLFIFDLQPSNLKYVFYFLFILIYSYVLTREENNEMFQPMEFEEVEHKLKRQK